MMKKKIQWVYSFLCSNQEFTKMGNIENSDLVETALVGSKYPRKSG